MTDVLFAPLQPIIYDSSSIYIESATSIEDRINKIDQIIGVLLGSILKAAEKAHILEYTLDDGMTIVKASYRDPMQVQASIYALERTKNYYIAKLNKSKQVRLVNRKSFNGRRWV